MLMPNGLVWVFTKTADPLGFENTAVSEAYKEYCEKEGPSFSC